MLLFERWEPSLRRLLQRRVRGAPQTEYYLILAGSKKPANTDMGIAHDTIGIAISAAIAAQK
jgi:hypothetical protein